MISVFLKKAFPKSFKNYIKLILNYWNDFKLYSKYSTVFSVDCIENKEAVLILNYHGIEKGLLHKKIRPRFAKNRIQVMHKLLVDEDIISNISNSQIFIGYKVIQEYYEFHKSIDVDISDYFTEDQYLFYYNVTKDTDEHKFSSGIQEYDFENFYAKHESFYSFSHSRKSIREFTGEKVSLDKIKKVIQLANNAPSVCNRQASKVYLVEDKQKIDECLKIQGGLLGFTENINQLLILTTDRRYFYISGERYQFYIDGGIYLLNLLYALHYYKIAACPANWGKDFIADRKVRRHIDIPDAEQIICMIPIGIAKEKISVTLSYRRTVDEVLRRV